MSDTDLEGVVNFRDFGGAPEAGGRRVRQGLLFRSGHHGTVADADLPKLEALDFALVVDLRRAAERVRDPSRRPAASRAEVLEHAAAVEPALAPHLSFLATPDASQDRVMTQMIAGYRTYPFDPYYVTLFSDYFARLDGLDGPVLVHCHAGKDRTGVLCALTLHVLGVSREDIYADYLETNRHNRADARLDAMAADFTKANGKPAPADLLRYVMMAEAAYLDAAFAAIEEAHGDVDAYLAEVLGVTAQRQAAIRERLLA
jgi:protein-tyrosine phosphatase